MKDHIDYWTVLDSNSTDNTTTVVENLMAGKPGQLLRTEFINFSTARNLALRVSPSIVPTRKHAALDDNPSS